MPGAATQIYPVPQKKGNDNGDVEDYIKRMRSWGETGYQQLINIRDRYGLSESEEE